MEAMNYHLPDWLVKDLHAERRTWLVTGAAGFIGSHLAQCLLQHDQSVIGLDNFMTGHRRNIDAVLDSLSPSQKNSWKLVEGDIRNQQDVNLAMKAADLVLHHAALGSVPRSIEEPDLTQHCNSTGSLNVFSAARTYKLNKVIYASSSSVYGDEASLPKVENKIGRQLSPYALSKLSNELWAEQFALHYGMQMIGFRYFNVFGPRQDPAGPYAAVIPRWIAQMQRQESVEIFGDGKTSRDFCFISNVVQINLAAALLPMNHNAASSQVYNVACNQQTDLNSLFSLLKKELAYPHEAIYRDFRAGDVRHSRADISHAQKDLRFDPVIDFAKGLSETIRYI